MSTQLFDLTGKRALVTGSSQGIGYALAKGLNDAGAEVILNGRDEAKLKAAADSLGAKHTTAFDATDHEAVRKAVDAFEAEVGPIDILVNNAGMQHRTPLEYFPADAFERILKTNISTVFNVGQTVARHMIARGTGKTHLATAIGIQAIEHHRKRVRLFSTVELVNVLEQEKSQGKAGQIANRLVHADLVILDDLGYLPFSASGGRSALPLAEQAL